MAQTSNDPMAQEEDVLPEEIKGAIIKSTKAPSKPAKPEKRPIVKATSPADLSPPEAVLDPSAAFNYAPNPAGTSPAVPADLINQHIINQIPQQDRPAAFAPPSQVQANTVPASSSVQEEDVIPTEVKGGVLKGPAYPEDYNLQAITPSEFWGSIFPGVIGQATVRAAGNMSDMLNPHGSFWSGILGGNAARDFFQGQINVAREGQQLAQQTGNPWEAAYRYPLSVIPGAGPMGDRLINAVRAGDQDEIANVIGDALSLRYGPKLGAKIGEQVIPRMIGGVPWMFSKKQMRNYRSVQEWNAAKTDLQSNVERFQKLSQEGNVQMAAGVAKQTMDDLTNAVENTRNDLGVAAKSALTEDFTREAVMDRNTGKQAVNPNTGRPIWNTFPIEGPVNIAKTQTLVRPVYEYFQRQLNKNNAPVVRDQVTSILHHLDFITNGVEGSYTKDGFPRLKGPVLEWDRAQPLSEALGEWLNKQKDTIPTNEQIAVRKFKEALDSDIDRAVGQFGPNARTAYNNFQDAKQTQRDIAGTAIAQPLKEFADNPKVGYEKVASAAVDGLNESTARQFKALTKNPQYLQDLTLQRLFTKYDTAEGFDFKKAQDEIRQNPKFYAEAVSPQTMQDVQTFLGKAQKGLKGPEPTFPMKPEYPSTLHIKASMAGLLSSILGEHLTPTGSVVHQMGTFGGLFSKIDIGTTAARALFTKLMTNPTYAKAMDRMMYSPQNSLEWRVSREILRNAVRGGVAFSVVDENNKRRPATIDKNSGQLVLGAPQ